MGKIDGIDPVRMADVLKRKALLEEFSRLKDPKEGDLATFAAAMGVSCNRFRTIHKAWLLRPDAEAISGATIKQDRQSKIEGEALAILGRTVEDMGVGHSGLAIAREVETRCRRAGVAPPSRTAVHYRLMKYRSDAGFGSDEGYSVFQCRLQLPVSTPEGIRSPWLTGAIDLATGRILHETVTIGEAADLAGTVRAVHAHNISSTDGAEIYVATKKLPTLPSELRPLVTPAGKARSGSVLLGSRIGGLTVLHRDYPGGDEKLARRVRGRMNSALSPAQAKAIIGDAVLRHNDNMTRDEDSR